MRACLRLSIAVSMFARLGLGKSQREINPVLPIDRTIFATRAAELKSE